MVFVCTETSLKDAFNNNKNTIDLSKNISKGNIVQVHLI